MKKIILFGSGHMGRDALHVLGEENVYCYCDNYANSNKKIEGKPVISYRELLQIYNEQKSFENVSDIMFVYNSMYNSNFLNIRNECIHGRDYLAGGKLRYAFRVTLLCIYMVMFRIDTIEEKVSDLID